MHQYELKALHKRLVSTAFKVDDLGNYAWNVNYELVQSFITELDLLWCLQVGSTETCVYIVPRHLNLSDENCDEFTVCMEIGKSKPVDLDDLAYKLGSAWNYRKALDLEARVLQEKIAACLGNGYEDEIERKFKGIRKLIRRTTL